jgi:hypothetical protein
MYRVCNQQYESCRQPVCGKTFKILKVSPKRSDSLEKVKIVLFVKKSNSRCRSQFIIFKEF